MKVCSSCSESKPRGDFGVCSKNKDGLYGKCKACKRAYDNEYHANRSKGNKKRKNELQRQRHISNRQYMYNFLKSHPCVVCGESDPVVLEFDHIDQSTKTTAVSLMADYSLDRVKEEIAKCRILCANCHKRHTAIQMGWYRHIER